MNYWQNYPKFMVSLLKANYGTAATADNEFAYSWLPKVDRRRTSPGCTSSTTCTAASVKRAGGAEEPAPRASSPSA